MCLASRHSTRLILYRGNIFILGGKCARPRRKNTTENSPGARRIIPRAPQHRRVVTCRDYRHREPDAYVRRYGETPQRHTTRDAMIRASLMASPGSTADAIVLSPVNFSVFTAWSDSSAGAKNSRKNRRSQWARFRRGKRGLSLRERRVVALGLEATVCKFWKWRARNFRRVREERGNASTRARFTDIRAGPRSSFAIRFLTRKISPFAAIRPRYRVVNKLFSFASCNGAISRRPFYDANCAYLPVNSRGA